MPNLLQCSEVSEVEHPMKNGLNCGAKAVGWSTTIICLLSKRLETLPFFYAATAWSLTIAQYDVISGHCFRNQGTSLFLVSTYEGFILAGDTKCFMESATGLVSALIGFIISVKPLRRMSDCSRMGKTLTIKKNSRHS